MAGSPEIKPLIEMIATLLGEELEIIELERMNPLTVSKTPINDFKTLPEGSAIIAFSRKDVLSYKLELERKKKCGVSVIYGNLSPEVRKEEARKFRDQENKYLVSTDAIAMGLNLPISNIVFSTLIKFNGETNNYLTPMEIKQISGRAGRFGKHEQGTISSTNKNNLNIIKKGLSIKEESPTTLFISPSFEIVKTLSTLLETKDINKIYTFFSWNIDKSNNGLYVCRDLKQLKELAFIVDRISLSLEDKYIFTMAPVPGEHQYSLYEHWLRNYSKSIRVNIPSLESLYIKGNRLFTLEIYLKILNLYSWLNFRKPLIFTDDQLCNIQRQKVNKEISDILATKGENLNPWIPIHNPRWMENFEDEDFEEEFDD
jgi:ATP-dependent RNA helicase SUPV3L1/SUV3